MTKPIAAHVRDLAAEVIPAEHRDTFMALPLGSQLVGLAVFAHVGHDATVRDACLDAVSLADRRRERIETEIRQHWTLRRNARAKVIRDEARGWLPEDSLMPRYHRWDTWRIRTLIAMARRLAR